MKNNGKDGDLAGSPAKLWDPCGRKGSPAPPWDAKGRLHSIAAMILMTLMYSARIARYDLQKAITFLAKRITCWDPLCDSLLHGLMCYVYKTVDYVMVGWIGDDPSLLTPNLFVDADYGGCPCGPQMDVITIFKGLIPVFRCPPALRAKLLLPIAARELRQDQWRKE